MIKSHSFAIIALGIALSGGVSPALAGDSRAGFDARAEAVAPEIAARVDQRDSAIHDCQSKASKFSESAWGNREFDTYRACMAEHGQPE